ncbi:protein PF3D7_1417600 isoform X2 [Aethina tumida]|uniref:protein PF3D7_1417600 isoform X2 n=1 Tax=Aethina tumida TaxID=116153 RepID=UPI002149301D|nr:protein PF3D7_1417600 isoform X2 [Aethina tumida]
MLSLESGNDKISISSEHLNDSITSATNKHDKSVLSDIVIIETDDHFVSASTQDKKIGSPSDPVINNLTQRTPTYTKINSSEELEFFSAPQIIDKDSNDCHELVRIKTDGKKKIINNPCQRLDSQNSIQTTSLTSSQLVHNGSIIEMEQDMYNSEAEDCTLANIDTTGSQKMTDEEIKRYKFVNPESISSIEILNVSNNKNKLSDKKNVSDEVNCSLSVDQDNPVSELIESNKKEVKAKRKGVKKELNLENVKNNLNSSLHMNQHSTGNVSDINAKPEKNILKEIKYIKEKSRTVINQDNSVNVIAEEIDNSSVSVNQGNPDSIYNESNKIINLKSAKEESQTETTLDNLPTVLSVTQEYSVSVLAESDKGNVKSNEESQIENISVNQDSSASAHSELDKNIRNSEKESVFIESEKIKSKSKGIELNEEIEFESDCSHLVKQEKSTNEENIIFQNNAIKSTSKKMVSEKNTQIEIISENLHSSFSEAQENSASVLTKSDKKKLKSKRKGLKKESQIENVSDNVKSQINPKLDNIDIKEKSQTETTSDNLHSSFSVSQENSVSVFNEFDKKKLKSKRKGLKKELQIENVSANLKFSLSENQEQRILTEDSQKESVHTESEKIKPKSKRAELNEETHNVSETYHLVNENNSTNVLIQNDKIKSQSEIIVPTKNTQLETTLGNLEKKILKEKSDKIKPKSKRRKFREEIDVPNFVNEDNSASIHVNSDKINCKSEKMDVKEKSQTETTIDNLHSSFSVTQENSASVLTDSSRKPEARRKRLKKESQIINQDNSANVANDKMKSKSKKVVSNENTQTEAQSDNLHSLFSVAQEDSDRVLTESDKINRKSKKIGIKEKSQTESPSGNSESTKKKLKSKRRQLKEEVQNTDSFDSVNQDNSVTNDIMISKSKKVVLNENTQSEGVSDNLHSSFSVAHENSVRVLTESDKINRKSKKIGIKEKSQTESPSDNSESTKKKIKTKRRQEKEEVLNTDSFHSVNQDNSVTNDIMISKSKKVVSKENTQIETVSDNLHSSFSVTQENSVIVLTESDKINRKSKKIGIKEKSQTESPSDNSESTKKKLKSKRRQLKEEVQNTDSFHSVNQDNSVTNDIIISKSKRVVSKENTQIEAASDNLYSSFSVTQENSVRVLTESDKINRKSKKNGIKEKSQIESTSDNSYALVSVTLENSEFAKKKPKSKIKGLKKELQIEDMSENLNFSHSVNQRSSVNTLAESDKNISKSENEESRIEIARTESNKFNIMSKKGELKETTEYVSESFHSVNQDSPANVSSKSDKLQSKSKTTESKEKSQLENISDSLNSFHSVYHHTEFDKKELKSKRKRLQKESQIEEVSDNLSSSHSINILVDSDQHIPKSKKGNIFIEHEIKHKLKNIKLEKVSDEESDSNSASLTELPKESAKIRAKSKKMVIKEKSQSKNLSASLSTPSSVYHSANVPSESDKRLKSKNIELQNESQIDNVSDNISSSHSADQNSSVYALDISDKNIREAEKRDESKKEENNISTAYDTIKRKIKNIKLEIVSDEESDSINTMNQNNSVSVTELSKESVKIKPKSKKKVSNEKLQFENKSDSLSTSSAYHTANVLSESDKKELKSKIMELQEESQIENVLNNINSVIQDCSEKTPIESNKNIQKSKKKVLYEESKKPNDKIEHKLKNIKLEKEFDKVSDSFYSANQDNSFSVPTIPKESEKIKSKSIKMVARKKSQSENVNGFTESDNKKLKSKRNGLNIETQTEDVPDLKSSLIVNQKSSDKVLIESNQNVPKRKTRILYDEHQSMNILTESNKIKPVSTRRKVEDEINNMSNSFYSAKESDGKKPKSKRRDLKREWEIENTPHSENQDRLEPNKTRTKTKVIKSEDGSQIENVSGSFHFSLPVNLDNSSIVHNDKNKPKAMNQVLKEESEIQVISDSPYSTRSKKKTTQENKKNGDSKCQIFFKENRSQEIKIAEEHGKTESNTVSGLVIQTDSVVNQINSKNIMEHQDDNKQIVSNKFVTQIKNCITQSLADETKMKKHHFEDKIHSSANSLSNIDVPIENIKSQSTKLSELNINSVINVQQDSVTVMDELPHDNNNTYNSTQEHQGSQTRHSKIKILQNIVLNNSSSPLKANVSNVNNSIEPTLQKVRSNIDTILSSIYSNELLSKSNVDINLSPIPPKNSQSFKLEINQSDISMATKKKHTSEFVDGKINDIRPVNNRIDKELVIYLNRINLPEKSVPNEQTENVNKETSITNVINFKSLECNKLFNQNKSSSRQQSNSQTNEHVQTNKTGRSEIRSISSMPSKHNGCVARKLFVSKPQDTTLSMNINQGQEEIMQQKSRMGTEIDGSPSATSEERLPNERSQHDSTKPNQINLKVGQKDIKLKSYVTTDDLITSFASCDLQTVKENETWGTTVAKVLTPIKTASNLKGAGTKEKDTRQRRNANSKINEYIDLNQNIELFHDDVQIVTESVAKSNEFKTPTMKDREKRLNDLEIKNKRNKNIVSNSAQFLDRPRSVTRKNGRCESTIITDGKPRTSKRENTKTKGYELKEYTNDKNSVCRITFTDLYKNFKNVAKVVNEDTFTNPSSKKGTKKDKMPSKRKVSDQVDGHALDRKRLCKTNEKIGKPTHPNMSLDEIVTLGPTSSPSHQQEETESHIEIKSSSPEWVDFERTLLSRSKRRYEEDDVIDCTRPNKRHRMDKRSTTSRGNPENTSWGMSLKEFKKFAKMMANCYLQDSSVKLSKTDVKTMQQIEGWN